MLSYLELKGFKSFSDIKFDLRKAHGEPKKVAFIYGENGSGKTNLMLSLLFLVQTLNTLENQLKLKDIPDSNNIVFDAMKDKRLQSELLQQMLRIRFSTLSDLISDYRMLGSKQKMSLKFGFRLDGADGSYLLEFSEDKIIKEELRYQINQREGVMFSLGKNKTTLSPTVFFDTAYKKELLENIEKYWGRHTFIAVLFNELQIKNEKYIKARISNKLMVVIDWLSKLSVWCKQYGMETARISIPLGFMRQLDKGSVKKQNNKELMLCETALNTFFTQLYTDIKSAYYVFTPEENNFSYELYFRKQIEGRIFDIPISLESTGTQKLLEIFPLLFASIAGASVFIDEIDCGIHDLLMKSLLENLGHSLEGQIVATTHNTLLMESLAPENTYIIRINANGGKSIVCVADYKQRTQKTNNIQNKYLRGDYDGIPYTGYLDLHEMVDEVLNKDTSSLDNNGEKE